jgi:non-lysosomal glucosylceramidase
MIDTFPHGAPLGGFGTGTFARTIAGDFSVWHLFNGAHIYEPLPFCNFAIYQKTNDKTYAYGLGSSAKNLPASWKPIPTKKVHYAAQYPKSWYHYDLPVEVTIEQFSPVLPHNYQTTAYPVACFQIQLENKQSSSVEASVLLSWQNFLGWGFTKDKNEYHFEKTKLARTNRRIESYEIKGFIMHADTREHEHEVLEGELCVAAKEVEGTKISVCTAIDATGDGHEVWETFSADGTIRDAKRTALNNLAGAIAIKTELNPGQRITVPLVIVWDIPATNRGRSLKYYNKFFSQIGTNAFALAKESIKQCSAWSEKISAWHNEYAHLPPWLTRALFNELYYLADGGSIWDAQTGRFTFLECYDYYFYETLDVRFYGSYPLALFWPEIEKSIMADFARTVFEENRQMIDYHTSATTSDRDSVAGTRNKNFIQRDQRKRLHALPHDIGSPFESPWQELNAYTWQNANRWKDLNSKFILMIYRAYYYSGKKDRDFLARHWNAIYAALRYMDEFDTDQDFLPENERFPDQTFDNWLMTGTSAYCGILRLASYQATIQIAEVLEKKDIAKQLRIELKKAKDSLNTKLWNGAYFNFDQASDDCMAGQLMGQWYLEQMHLPSVIPKNYVQTTLTTIYQKNFLSVNKGLHGLVNGRTVDGLPVRCSQGNDIWTGISAAVAAHLLLNKKEKQAFRLLKTTWSIVENRGFLFRTPEGWDENDQFIGSMYMRPGALWAVADVLKSQQRK